MCVYVCVYVRTVCPADGPAQGHLPRLRPACLHPTCLHLPQVVGELMTALQRMLNPLNRWFWWRKVGAGPRGLGWCGLRVMAVSCRAGRGPQRTRGIARAPQLT